ncbi:MAG: hypothetical protein ACJAT7_000665 [Psychromonas sp.]|jgi:uncharacterized protein YkwD|uniref:CAP domain-containing protein n=1 Tax=Psychromonas sp. TaxID=1884585 RepID=UPI0039E5FFFF
MRLLLLRSSSICVAGLLLTACGVANGNTVISAATVAAKPLPAPISVSDTASTAALNSALIFNQEMLFAVNAARAQARKCGGRSMPAVAELTWNKQLQQAAFVHSTNMARYDFFSHTGLDGKEVSQRIRDQGYNWRSAGENISAGAADVATVMAGWLSSPGHCLNIMSANFTEMAAAVVTNNSTYYGSYWTQVFAAPF